MNRAKKPIMQDYLRGSSQYEKECNRMLKGNTMARFSKLRILHGYLFETKREIQLLAYRFFNRLNIMQTEETIQYIERHKCNVSRLGDGEIRMICIPDYSIGFQKNDEKLVKLLLEVLSAKRDNLLLCLPVYLIDRSRIKKEYRTMWEQHNRNCYIKFFRLLKQLDASKTMFGNASFSRPYHEFTDSSNAKLVFDWFKKLCAQKRILIVEGELTRLGIGNDLLDGAISVERITAPAKNAFEKYEEILSAVVKHYSGQLVLLALGPTATILAAELSKHNIWAIDIGHIDIEYEWYLAGSSEKTPIPNKYVNEVRNGDAVCEENDPQYLSQIIQKIKD